MNISQLARESRDRFGEYVALHFEGRSYTNTEHEARTVKLTAALQALGIGRDDRVMVLMPNCPEVLNGYMATLRLGAAVVPVLSLLQAEEIRHILEDSQARAVLTTPLLAGNVAQARSQKTALEYVILIGDGEPPATGLEGVAVHRFAELLAGAPEACAEPDVPDDHLAALIYTSGTTGAPKGVMLSHGNLVSNATAAAETQQLSHDDVGLSVLPLSHSFGLIVSIASMQVGPSAVLLTHFDPETVAENVARYQVTTMTAVPTMLTYLLQSDVAPEKLASLTTVICAAAPLEPRLHEEFEARFGCRILQGYGLTEASPAVSLVRPDQPFKPGSSGPPIPGVSVQIRDAMDQVLPAGETGEIWVHGPGVMQGYHNQPVETAKTVVDGWLDTGDMGYLDADGELYIVDRKKDLIIRGGFNILPCDVEEVLLRHPGVEEAAVIGVPDPVLGEQVKAYVVTGPGQEVTAEELVEFCQQSLAKHKTPQQVEFIPFLPKNIIGKVLKKELRQKSQS